MDYSPINLLISLIESLIFSMNYLHSELIKCILILWIVSLIILNPSLFPARTNFLCIFSESFFLSIAKNTSIGAISGQYWGMKNSLSCWFFQKLNTFLDLWMDQLSKITPISSVFHPSHSFKVLMSTSRNLMNSSEFVFEVEICHSANPFEVIDPMIFMNCEYPTLLILEDTPLGSQD